MQQPMEVFHYHKARVRTNFKLWHDTNSEFYHDFLHYFNRITGMMQPGYFERKYTGFPNGHATVGSMQIQYDKYDGSKERAVGWPGLARGGWYMVDVFPGMTYNLRTSVLRIDTAIPLGPNEVIIEFRGLGLKSDSEEERRQRVFDHNMIWGPFGRNLHEDLLGVHGQGRAMRRGTDSRWVLQGREENNTIHDEVGMRHYYAEWSRRMGRPAYDPCREGKPDPVRAVA
jgi:methanesulfonate monooxygenase large subunit